MPRIHPRVFRAAHALHPHLARLLPVCGDLRSAQNELRWLREHAGGSISDRKAASSQESISSLVHRRACGEPLQYILGTEFFADLEIKCRPGVLIPRPETASSVSYLVHLVSAHLAEQTSPSHLRVLDFCTGTGCIPLLFHDEFYKHTHLRNVALDIKGYDISQQAISLAYENLDLQWERPENRHLRAGRIDETLSCRNESLGRLRFEPFDVLATDAAASGKKSTGHHLNAAYPKKLGAMSDATSPNAGIDTRCDVLISNPPYISPSDYKRTTARSVRKFEPELALVPPSSYNDPNTLNSDDKDQGDLFYPPLLSLARRLSAKFVLLEVSDMEQAVRVVFLVLRKTTWDVDVEIWKDEPARNSAEEVLVDGKGVKVIGEGNGRSVFIRRRGVNGWMN